MDTEIIIPQAAAIRKSLDQGILDFNALRHLLMLIENGIPKDDLLTNSQAAYRKQNEKFEERRKKRLSKKIKI